MKIQNYNLVKFQIREEFIDFAVAYIDLFPHQGIEEDLDSLIVTFREEDFNDEIAFEILNYIKGIDELAKLESINLLADKNWNEEWEKNVKIIKVNANIGIAPEWKLSELDTKIKIAINPKMSFGTGEHATTRLVCRLMDTTIFENKYVIDIGTGTGVLAILAKLLGAYKVDAFDNNEWAIDNAIQNIRMNGLLNKINVFLEDIDEYPLPHSDIILANLFTNLHLQNFNKYHMALKDNGILIISGIMQFDRQKIIKESELFGFEILEELFEDEWISIKFSKKI